MFLGHNAFGDKSEQEVSFWRYVEVIPMFLGHKALWKHLDRLAWNCLDDRKESC